MRLLPVEVIERPGLSTLYLVPVETDDGGLKGFQGYTQEEAERKAKEYARIDR